MRKGNTQLECANFYSTAHVAWRHIYLQFKLILIRSPLRVKSCNLIHVESPGELLKLPNLGEHLSSQVYVISLAQIKS